MKPTPIWTYQHPTTVSGVAVDEGGNIATSCFDGRLRVITPAGGVLVDTDVSPGTINQDRQCVAFRFGKPMCGENFEYAIAIRDDETICRPNDVPTVRTVRDISRRARFAVADDCCCYNLVTGDRWQISPPPLDPFFAPPGCAEDGERVWTVGPDGELKLWEADGRLVLSKFLTTKGVNSVDANGDEVVVTDWGLGISLYDKLGNLKVSANDLNQIHQAKFLNDGRVVYGDAAGRLVCWDGSVEPDTAPTEPPPTTTHPSDKPNPGKGHGKPDK